MEEHFFVLCDDGRVIQKIPESDFRNIGSIMRDLIGDNVDIILRHFSELPGDEVGGVGFNMISKQDIVGSTKTQVFSLTSEPGLGEYINIKSFYRERN